MNTINCVVVFVAMLSALLCIEIAGQTTRIPLAGATETAKVNGIELYPINTDVQEALSEQISLELTASVKYLSMASYYGQDDISLKGFKKFFMDNSDEEKEHAKKLVNYLNERDGKLGVIKIEDVTYGNTGKVISGLEGLRLALELEIKVSASLVALHKLAQSKSDIHLADALENDLLREQVESTRLLKGLITRLDKMGAAAGNYKLAEYFFDQELQEKS